MVQFLTTAGVNSAIETIIRKAKKKLVLVSPFLQLSQILFERLEDADKRVEEIIYIYGKNKLNDAEWKKIIKLKKLKLFYYENLHAKCYFNDSMMVITSMNLYEHAIRNNREMGLLITRDDENNSEIYNDAAIEIQEIINNAVDKLPKRAEAKIITKIDTKKEVTHKEQLTEKGYCVRCREQIDLDPEKPYCLECFSIWKEYYNPNYMEFYCHQCGQNYKSTMKKPLCTSCFKEK